MALENLKSIFSEGVGSDISKPVDKKTKTISNTPNTPKKESGIILNTPTTIPIKKLEKVLDTPAPTPIKNPKGVSDFAVTKPKEKFESILTDGLGNNLSQIDGRFIDKNSIFDDLRISDYQINQPLPNGSPSSQLTSTIELRQLGTERLYYGEGDSKNQSWQNLYNTTHTPKNDPKWNGKSAYSINYLNTDSDNINIRGRTSDAPGGIFSFSRTQGIGAGAGEPYIVSEIPKNSSDILSGRLANSGNRTLPIGRLFTDAFRLTKYLSSPAGIAFIAKQNLLGLNSKVETPLSSASGEQPSTLVSPQLYGTFYNPLSTLGAAFTRLGTQSIIKFRRDELLPSAAMTYPSVTMNNLNSTFGGYSELIDVSTSFPVAAGSKIKNPIKRTGDKMTLANMIKGESLNFVLGGTQATPVPGEISPSIDERTLSTNIESIKNGMPFYFKDLRDNAYIFFRAYIEGLSENVSPSWSAVNYIGRSEPTYVYERGERDINFTLKLVAQTRDELDSIYQKMNRLTSLCYPKYKEENPIQYSKTRMQPPLTKLRLGELYGKENNELTGFIKSLSYSIDPENIWEVEKGARVPRNITATISYQVIHASVPQLDTNFYGFVGA